MNEFTRISLIGEQGKGKTIYSECPYCHAIDYNVVIMFHVLSCPKQPIIEEVVQQ